MSPNRTDWALSSAEADHDLFEMANLYPRDTGLPITIWVIPRGHARHDVRIKACTTPGDRMDADNTVTAAVRPQPHVGHGELSINDQAAMCRWIAANEAALVEYWNGVLSTGEFVRGIASIS